jgi:spermidine synthase
MAAFGVTTPLVSIVLSVFMAGLAIGSAGGGYVARRLERSPRRALVMYAALEAAIAACALLVPWALTLGRRALSVPGTGVAWESGAWYLAATGWIAVTLAPACVAMGATYPFAMAAIRGQHPDAGPRTFGFLYLANVLGAACGTLAAAFVLIELLGFRMTLVAGAVVQTVVAVGAFIRARRAPAVASASAASTAGGIVAPRPAATVLLGLFLTGLASMAMELVWIRQYTPYLGNVVYAFAGILATYLLATFVGSQIARTALGRLALGHAGVTWLLAGLAGLLPLLATDPRLTVPAILRLVLGVGPVCILCGLLTPILVDRWSGGDPGRAGLAYAVNVIGSIAGPLVAAFVLLSRMSETAALVGLALPLFAAGALAVAWPRLLGGDAAPRSRRPLAAVPAVALAAIGLVGATHSYETLFPAREVRRDHTATVMAAGAGRNRTLQVNGASMTALSSITKTMAHLPLASLDRPPKDALMICFGMGTTFRSLLAWDIEATAVELVPSVPDLFWYYHADARDLARSPKARIVIDDGRRLLERSPHRYDVITIDPPHPPEAAGSSLLYTREFYAVARARLREGGILQQWIPKTDAATIASVARALGESFPHVRVFPVVVRHPELDVLGLHFLASDRAIPRVAPGVLASKLPPRARADALEWYPTASLEAVFGVLLENERTVDEVIALARWAPTLEDDRPFNEYYLLRRLLLQ